MSQKNWTQRLILHNSVLCPCNVLDMMYLISTLLLTYLLCNTEHQTCNAQLGIRASQKIRQSCALQIIIPYEEACCMLNLSALADRRRSMSSTLFKQTVSREFHILHCSLPPKRDAEVTSRLRSMNKYPTVRVQIYRYKNSFILYGFLVTFSATCSHNVCMCMCVFELFFLYSYLFFYPSNPAIGCNMLNKRVVVVVNIPIRCSFKRVAFMNNIYSMRRNAKVRCKSHKHISSTAIQPCLILPEECLLLLFLQYSRRFYASNSYKWRAKIFMSTVC